MLADRVPDAGEPVCDQDEHEDEQDEHGSAILQVVVELAGDPAQPQQAHHLQRAEQAADTL